MKALLFDPFSGASGDMIMGCLLDLGADASKVRETVESLGCGFEITRESRSHIAATRAKVLSDKRYRSLDVARDLLQKASLDPPAKSIALKAMDALAAAEGRVHGIDSEEVRFHEIGSMDALADIAGCSAALVSLKVEKVLSLPISVGGGTVPSSHGLLPVPGPAALEILRSFEVPWKGGPVDQELLTPTGAALLAVIVDSFLEEYPSLITHKTGYGAGSRSLPMPNVLRGVIVEINHRHLTPDRIVQLETNLDDVTGEVLGNLIELLMEAGALDVSVIPAVMKKGRMGNVVRAIARHDDIQKLSELIMLETGSLGIRVFPSLHRLVAEREQIYLQVEIKGSVYRASVKISRMDRSILNIKPEFEDCKRIASDTGLPLREVIKIVEAEGRRMICL